MDLKELFNKESVGAVAGAVHSQCPAFDQEAFLAAVFGGGWPSLELKERMRHVTVALHDGLSGGYRAALGVLRQALPHVGDHGFVKMVFCDFVEVYGLDDWEASIPALEEFTQQMSAEFAIRPFIVRYPERTMAQMLRWAHHPSADVRRLSSEGCRPRLPWGIRLPALIADPLPILPILEALRHDESESVRRSVANNLNDIAKDHPALVIDLLRRWQADDTPAMRALIHHALRTLIKKGDPGALALLGHSTELAIAVHNLAVDPQQVAIGSALAFSFDIESRGDDAQDLVIDYVVYHMRANGQLSPKVFKLTKRTLQPGEVVHVIRRHSFAPVTTRRYYPGEHAIEIQINGQSFGRVNFSLTS
jgi:3-methyladenine DNA glycosylase AlkC